MTQCARREVTQVVLDHARQMAQECGARTLVLCADVFTSPEDVKKHLTGTSGGKTVIVTRDAAAFQDSLTEQVRMIHVPAVDLTRMGQIKMAILLGTSRNVLGRGDRLVCLSGVPRSDDLDTVLFTEVGEEFEMFAAAGGAEIREHSNPEVFEKVLDIAVELGQEGREGKPVGTIFVIGDIERVRQFSEPLMLNPLQGHSESYRNILSPRLRETVKELSSLDGAFLIRDNGVVEAAGMFLRSVIPGSELPHGLGARHRSAAGITAATDATAITVSESTGTVTVFRGGRIIIEIEKPRAIGSMALEPKQLLYRSGAGEGKSPRARGRGARENPKKPFETGRE
jgi:diadenylate cyclase